MLDLPSVGPGSALVYQIGTCNELETAINKERARDGQGPLKCDHNMRWVANKHVSNQLDNGYNGQVSFHDSHTPSLVFLIMFISKSIRYSMVVVMLTLGSVTLVAVSKKDNWHPGLACGINPW